MEKLMQIGKLTIFFNQLLLLLMVLLIMAGPAYGKDKSNADASVIAQRDSRANKQQFNYGKIYASFQDQVEFYVTDPLGRRQGFDPRINREYHEITGAFFARTTTHSPPPEQPLPRVLELYEPDPGEYIFTVIGVVDENYTAFIYGCDRNNEPNYVLVDYTTIKKDEVHTYKVKYSDKPAAKFTVWRIINGQQRKLPPYIPDNNLNKLKN